MSLHPLGSSFDIFHRVGKKKVIIRSFIYYCWFLSFLSRFPFIPFPFSKNFSHYLLAKYWHESHYEVSQRLPCSTFPLPPLSPLCLLPFHCPPLSYLSNLPPISPPYQCSSSLTSLVFPPSLSPFYILLPPLSSLTYISYFSSLPTFPFLFLPSFPSLFLLLLPERGERERRRREMKKIRDKI